MKAISGVFNGTGAALYLGLGFVPDWVKVYNLEDADVAVLEWNKHMARTADMTEGRLNHTAAGLVGDPRTVSDGGIRPYRGGDVIASASTAYLVQDETDYRTSATYGTVKTWTLDTSANRTGHFNLEADTSYVGEGSLIVIREDVSQNVIECGIVAMTSNGEQADEVTLSEAVKSGEVLSLGRMYDYVGASAGVVMPAGFSIQATTVINVSGEMCAFEAGTYA